MNNILVIGATSAIAHSVCKKFCMEPSTFYLVGRSKEKLSIIADDLRVRGAITVHIDACDFVNPAEYENLSQRVIKLLPSFDIVFIAHGSLSDQDKCEVDTDYVSNELSVNFTSTIALSLLFSRVLKKQKHGTLAVVSSVAGERGRQSNYIYGAAKAGITAFCSGLRNKLIQDNVHVLTILPGFVDTPMTSHIPKNFLFASSDKVADDIVNAIKKKKDVLYTPFFWKYVMIIVRSIPEGIFKKLKT